MRKINHAGFSKREITDLTKSWLFISVAFGIALFGLNNLMSGLLIALVTVGTGFLLHELTHKFLAQRYGCFAEFRANQQMLWLMLIISFFGFVFAAPGAVMIMGRVTKREHGIIAIGGPVTNITLAILFALINFVLPTFGTIWQYGFMINSWLAFFNMIPFWVLDGKKVYDWNRNIFWLTIGIAALFAFVLQNYFF